ncbi:MAG: RHS repeat-associated core domain-containing protein [Fimbriimonadaceae bacterium]
MNDPTPQTNDYTTNAVNQYTAITNPDPGKRKIKGQANTDATVTVTQSNAGLQPAPLTVTRSGTTFTATAEAPTTTAPAFLNVKIEGRKDGAGVNGGPIVVTKESGFYFPPKEEALAYDDDGNLILDGRWTWAWDGENRLKSMETTAAAVAAGVPKQRLEFVYDSQSRRVRKVVNSFSSTTNGFVVTTDTRFLYDGWNVIAEFTFIPQTSSFILSASYAWGLDLSGTETGAGGVGGLLFVSLYSLSTTNPELSTTTTLSPAYDGNGNILAYLNCPSGTVQARYEYDPFGKLLIKDEDTSVVGRLHHQFSTKYCDAETGLSYYGFRYYRPEDGRFVGRDPIGERGGINLYGMVANNALNRRDILGLEDCGCTIPNNPTNVPRGISAPTVADPRTDFSVPTESPVVPPTISAGGAAAGAVDLTASMIQAWAAQDKFDTAKSQCGPYKGGCNCCVVAIVSMEQENSATDFKNGNRRLYIEGNGHLVETSCAKQQARDKETGIMQGAFQIDMYYIDW